MSDSMQAKCERKFACGAACNGKSASMHEFDDIKSKRDVPTDSMQAKRSRKFACGAACNGKSTCSFAKQPD